MAVQRLSIESEGGEPLWVEADRDGEYVRWGDVAELVVSVSGLTARIELAHDLHAVFTIKDTQEFQKVKAAVDEIFRQTSRQ